MTVLSHAHVLLLRAALLRGAAALDAWHEWQTITTVDSLDGDSQWLLPLLGWNLRIQGVTPSFLTRYHNVYRHNWYKNHLTLRRAEIALAPFGESASAPLLLGGAAMALRCYPALGCRPFERVQVLLPADVVMQPDSPVDDRTTLQAHNAVESPESPYAIEAASPFDAALENNLRAHAAPLAWRGLRALVLDPAAQLAHIFASADTWDRRSRLLWIADAVMLLASHPDIDRGRAGRIARDMRRFAEFSAAADLLQRHFSLEAAA